MIRSPKDEYKLCAPTYPVTVIYAAQPHVLQPPTDLYSNAYGTGSANRRSYGDR